MMKKFMALVLVIAMAGYSGTCQAAAKNKAKKGKKAKTEQVETKKKNEKYDKLFEKEKKCADGMFKVHLADGKVYFELPYELLDREMLMGATIKSTSDNGNGVVGSKNMDLKHFIFHQPDTSVIQLREVETSYFSKDDNIKEALSKSIASTISNSFKIKAVNADSTAVVFDVTDMFINDDKNWDPFLEISAYSRYDRERQLKKDLSYIVDVKSFSDNVSVTSSLSYTYSVKRGERTLLKDAPFTAEMVYSIVLLPKETYHPRIADPRIGVFFHGREKFGDNVSSTKPVYFANRWRLEPSDTAAYRRGELVEPVKPIVFYIDNNFPEWWKPYIRSSASDWNDAFEKIGFKNAVVTKDFPTPEEDPEFDPDNIKYSCIRYAPIGIQNAMGPSWIDPRSGEIINASVYVYHDIVKLITDWIFVQTSQADPDVRAAELPREILGDALCYVIRHEVGHCLGLMHNMSASYVIPVESLRDPEFTQKNGTTTSIMDYARFNYVAQPGDKERGVKLTPPKFGSYDYWAIRWAYTPVFGAENFKEEEKITSGWISDSLKAAPFYHYGKQQMGIGFFDPRRQTEDLGDDAIAATKYGVKNLKYIMSNYMNWIKEGDDEFEFRCDILNELVNQYYRYANHVWGSVGGMYINEVKQGDIELRYQNVPEAKQKESLEYLFELWKDCDWLSDSKVIGRLPVVGSPTTAVREAMQEMIMYSPVLCSVSNGIASDELSAHECMDIIYDKVWGPTVKGKALSRAERSFQNYFVMYYMALGNFKMPGVTTGHSHFSSDARSITAHRSFCSCDECNSRELGEITYSPVSGFEWQPRAIFTVASEISAADFYGELVKARSLLKNAVKGANAEDKAHYQLLIDTINYSIK